MPVYDVEVSIVVEANDLDDARLKVQDRISNKMGYDASVVGSVTKLESDEYDENEVLK